MINTVQIALGGLAPGSSPVTIATQGLIVTITPPEEQQDAAWTPLRSYGPPNAAPYDSRKGKKKRVDCVVDIEGVRGTLTCTDRNLWELAQLEKILPILAEHCLKHWRWKRLCAAKKEPETAAARAKIARKTKAMRRAERETAAQLADFQDRKKGTKTKDLAESIFWRDRQIAELHEQMAKLLLEKTR